MFYIKNRGCSLPSSSQGVSGSLLGCLDQTDTNRSMRCLACSFLPLLASNWRGSSTVPRWPGWGPMSMCSFTRGFPAIAWSFFQLLGLEEPGGAWLSGTAYLESHKSPPGRLFLLCPSPQGCQQHQLVGWAYSLSISWSPACSGTITPTVP